MTRSLCCCKGAPPLPAVALGLFALIFTAPAAPATAQVCSAVVAIDQFRLTFVGTTFNPGPGITTYDYCIENLGGQALSHWVLEACFPPSALSACSPAPCFYQVNDPTTGVTGVKFDNLTLDSGQTECYSFEVLGDFTSPTDVTAAMKYAQVAAYGGICGPDCAAPVCGDGNLDPGEECDDGNNTDGDGCDADCAIEPFCGDGSINDPDETCDPPGDHGCRDDCTFCGDGLVQPDAGEECDDGNRQNGDGCSSTCLPEGVPTLGEWGRLLLALALTAIGVLVLRRRQRAG